MHALSPRSTPHLCLFLGLLCTLSGCDGPSGADEDGGVEDAAASLDGGSTTDAATALDAAAAMDDAATGDAARPHDAGAPSGDAGDVDAGSPDAGSFTCTSTVGPSVPAARRFDGVAPGDVLCLEDGVYTGGLNVPSGVTVAALHVGGPMFRGGDDPWTAILRMEGDGSTVVGVRVREPDNSTSNACQIAGTGNTLRASSCAHGGAHKHKIPLRVGGTGHLIEDSWFFGEGRYVVQCFVGDHITFRRNVARWDATAPDEATEPNATFSNYNCSSNLWENNISLDYGVPETPMRFGGDFYSPCNLAVYPTGNVNNRWLGNFAVNHATGTENRRAFRADSRGSSTLTGNVVHDFFVRDNGIGFVIRPTYEFDVERCTMIDVELGAGSYSTAAGAAAIDCGSGATVDRRYVDGVQTSEPLWPFAFESLIRADLCAPSERHSDFCDYSGSLEDYVLGR